jgi:3-(3-hydroxy-phenyl)propionate hydroxylase/6-hydroxy-3-succinoylpyridine 3-monooxygenase
MRPSRPQQQSSGVSTSDVVVVGAGPVGALLALGLAQRGHEVVLLEAEPDIVESPRAMVYYWHVLEGLDRLGVLDDMLARGFRNTAFLQRVLRTGLQADVPLTQIERISPYAFNVHLGQHEVVRIALEHLRRLPNAHIAFDARVTDLRHERDHVVVESDGENGRGQWRASWVVGADGARSTIRRSVGLGFEGTTWPDRFVATNIRYPFDQLGGLGNANMLFDPDQGCVIARIDETGLYRWTWSEPADLPEETIADRLPSRLASLGFGDAEYVVDAVAPYRMHQRSADAMRDGHVLLVGDAAHATNPTGGYGLTSGVYDVLALVEPLSGVLRKTVPEAALDAWASLRLAAFRDHASPMASHIKHMVYDETDLAKVEGLVRTAADQRDPDAVLARLSGMTVLRGDLPRHFSELP